LAELDYIWSIYEFENLEDIIRLSHSLKNENESKISTKLYGYNGKYYLYIEMNDITLDYHDDLFSQISEFGEEIDQTVHILSEYVKLIFEKDVFNQIKVFIQLFSLIFIKMKGETMSQAVNENGELIKIANYSRSELNKLKRKKYYCIDCNKRLILKVGNRNRPHFTHMSESNEKK